jgi:hypothetical protein
MRFPIIAPRTRVVKSPFLRGTSQVYEEPFREHALVRAMGSGEID